MLEVKEVKESQLNGRRVRRGTVDKVKNQSQMDEKIRSPDVTLFVVLESILMVIR